MEFFIVVGIIACCYYSNKSKETKKQAVKSSNIEVICPHCSGNVSIDSAGEWVCPHCKKEFSYSGDNSRQSSTESNHTNYNDNKLHVNCPYCNNKIYIESEGTWICPNCSNNFIYRGTKVYRNEDACNDAILCMITVLAKLAKADGLVTKKEISQLSSILDNDLELNLIQKKEVQEIFNREKQNYTNYENHLRKLYDIFSDDRTILTGFLEQMFKFAYEDGGVHPEQEKILLKTIDIFRLSTYDYQEIKGKFIENLDKYYSALNCNRNSTDEEIKSSYRKLMITYHPDKYASKDLPEEMIRLAKEKTQEIQNAYEEIKKSRNL